MLRLSLLCFFCCLSILSTAQKNDSSFYINNQSPNFNIPFSLQWKYPDQLKQMLPTNFRKVIINWQEFLRILEGRQTEYKTIILPQKEVLASCALMLVLLDKEPDSKFYQTKTTYLQLLRKRLNTDENKYLEDCLNYLEQQQTSQKGIISLWQTYFHYAFDTNEALYAAQKLLTATQKTSDLSVEEQEDLIATTYYLIGFIYKAKGYSTEEKKYYTLCYELRKKRGDDLYDSMYRILSQTNPSLEIRRALYKDLLNSIKEYGCREDTPLFDESMSYLLKNKIYDLAVELFEEGTLKHDCLQNIKDLSYRNSCPYLYLAVEALSKGSEFDDPSQDSIAIIWFKKWVTVLDTIISKNAALTSKSNQKNHFIYKDHTYTRIIDYLLYYGHQYLAKDFFEAYQKPLYLNEDTNPLIIYNLNFFYYKFIPHHTVVLNDSLVLQSLKDYLDFSYGVIKEEEKVSIENLERNSQRGRESIAYLGQTTTDSITYLQYLEYWLFKTKELNYQSEEILAHRYYCAALRKNKQYIKAFEYALKLNKLSHSNASMSIQEYTLKIREYALDNVLNNYEIDSKKRQEAMLIVKELSKKKDRKWRRSALKQLQKQASLVIKDKF